jgi:hypothetical protein
LKAKKKKARAGRRPAAREANQGKVAHKAKMQASEQKLKADFQSLRDVWAKVGRGEIEAPENKIYEKKKPTKH